MLGEFEVSKPRPELIGQLVRIETARFIDDRLIENTHIEMVGVLKSYRIDRDEESYVFDGGQRLAFSRRSVAVDTLGVRNTRRKIYRYVDMNTFANVEEMMARAQKEMNGDE